MPLKIVALTASALTLLALPALAQSMFEQMPTVPDDNAAQRTANADTGAAGMAPMPVTPPMSAPATAAVPQAQSLGGQGANGVNCQAIQKTLEERKNLVARANAASTSKKKMTPQEACGLFGQLQANGNVGIKWITTNKEWCSIPDSFAEGFKADNAKVAGIRNKVCSMAAQYSKMEAQARENGGAQGGGGLLGGPGLSGNFRMPQGAL